MNRKLKTISPEALKSATRQADAMAESLKAERDLSRVIVHVDMDAFYAAVEERDNPELKVGLVVKIVLVAQADCPTTFIFCAHSERRWFSLKLLITPSQFVKLTTCPHYIRRDN